MQPLSPEEALRVLSPELQASVAARCADAHTQARTRQRLGAFTDALNLLRRAREEGRTDALHWQHVRKRCYGWALAHGVLLGMALGVIVCSVVVDMPLWAFVVLCGVGTYLALQHGMHTVAYGGAAWVCRATPRHTVAKVHAALGGPQAAQLAWALPYSLYVPYLHAKLLLDAIAECRRLGELAADAVG